MPVVSMFMTRRFAFFSSTLSASTAKPGAMTASTNWPVTFLAVAASTFSLKARMPPKAEVGSQAHARS